jgi:DNA helicase-2/ATP-dependent DNA helicase PcrA
MYGSLTDKQREIVFNKKGKFVVRACPGSGKTYCVSARLARLINEWDKHNEGIAVLSFTNVAWQEIEKKYAGIFSNDTRITYPHFLGTIDSFINKYIFLPFGHLVLKCPSRPTLVGEPHGIWSGGRYDKDYNQYFDICSFDINGTLIPTGGPQSFEFSWKNNKDGSVNGNVINLEKAKKNLLSKGYANQSDANYFAMRILEAYPQIAGSLALRFPFLIVDEAQDTSEIQMRIIDLLINNGLNEVMLVGDPDQAIFEWNDARPDLLNDKYAAWPESMILNESRRSSQKICDFTYKISSLPAASVSVNEEVRDFAFQPNIITYQPKDLPKIVNEFVKECVANGIAETREDIAIIYRSKGLISDITGVKEIPFTTKVWLPDNSCTKDFAKGKYLYDCGDFKRGLRLIDKAFVKLIRNLSHCGDGEIQTFIDEFGFVKFRSAVFQFLGCLPQTNIPIGEWVQQVNANFANNNIKRKLQIEASGFAVTFKQLFLYDDASAKNFTYRLGTVHSSKGETFDATLLILKTKGIGSAYKTLLNNNVPISQSEELRITYVGMTRPRKILTIAVPDDENKDAWEKRLI